MEPQDFTVNPIRRGSNIGRTYYLCIRLQPLLLALVYF